MSWPAIDCLEHHPAFAVAGVAATLAADDAAAIARLWQEADPAAIAAAVSDRTSDRLFVLRDGRGDDAGDQVEMVVGYAVPPGATAAAPMAVREVPAATYARIDAAGRSALAALWATLAAGDLPRSGPDFEVHGTAGEDGEDSPVCVYVAIDPAAFAHPALAARLAAVARQGVLGRLTFDERGLIPAVAQQHDTGEVLMVAWMDRAAVEETLATRRVTYWSRSRRRLWRKGETSGHVQRLVDLRLDCDGDTLLVLVDQTGPACHTGERTCFFRTARSGVIAEVADKGPAAPPPGRPAIAR